MVVAHVGEGEEGEGDIGYWVGAGQNHHLVIESDALNHRIQKGY